MAVLDLLLIMACLGSGMMAGLFVSFSTFMMTALGSLEDSNGIRVMQAINRHIVRPSFLMVFLGTAAALLAASYLSYGTSEFVFIILATLVYVFACVLSTIIFNVPLNDRLADCDPEHLESQRFWRDYLVHWTRWNHLRSVACVVSILILALTLLGR
ncbi:MAG: DUF1772 domain-containing protein [Aestuariibacter sp.]